MTQAPAIARPARRPERPHVIAQASTPDAPWVRRYGLPAVLVSFLFLAVTYSLVVPPFEATDEISHFRFGEFLKAERRLPRQSHDPARLENVVAHNPPLYYLTIAIVTWPLPTTDLNEVAPVNPDFVWGDLSAGGPFVHLHNPARETIPGTGAILALRIARLVSVVAGLISVLFAFRIGARLLGGAPGGLAVAALTAFLPSFLFTSATVHNDSFVTMFAIVAVDRLMKAAEAGRRRDVVLSGLFVALAGLSKLAGLLLAPLLIVPFVVAGRKSGWREAFLSGALAALPLIVLVGPWVVWNMSQYGEPFGFVLFSTNPLFPIRDEALPLAALPAELGPTSLLFHTFVLAFGYMDRLGPPVLYEVARWLVALAITGLVIRQARDPRGVRASLTSPAAIIAIIWAILLTASLGRYVQTFLSGGHGRYLFPALPVIAAALISGWQAILPRGLGSLRRFTIAFPLALLALATPFWIITPGYTLAGEVTGPEAITLADRPAIATFAGQIDVVESAVPNRVRPGESATVRLTWRARQSIGRSYQAFVQLVRQGRGIAGQDRAPGAGLGATVRWTTGTLVADRFELTVPAEAEAGVYEVWTGFYPRSTLERLRVTAGEDRDGAAVVGRFVVPQRDPGQPTRRIDLDYGQQLRLVGTGSIPDRIAATTPITVELHWQALRRSGVDYTVSVQAIDGAGRVAGQLDGPPFGGALPTGLWDEGERVTERRRIQLAPGTAPGTYRLVVIVYQRESGSRLATSAGDAPAIGEFVVGGE